jgi:hypothetical protein
MKSLIALIAMSFASLSFAAEPAKSKPTAPASAPVKAEKPVKKAEAKKDLGKKPTAKKVEQK